MGATMSNLAHLPTSTHPDQADAEYRAYIATRTTPQLAAWYGYLCARVELARDAFTAATTPERRHIAAGHLTPLIADRAAIVAELTLRGHTLCDWCALLDGHHYDDCEQRND
jgi:hypothetical protein